MEDISSVETIELPIIGMSSPACVARIRGMLAGTPGLVTLEVELGRVEIGFSPEGFRVEDVRREMEALGYKIPSAWASANAHAGSSTVCETAAKEPSEVAPERWESAVYPGPR